MNRFFLMFFAGLITLSLWAENDAPETFDFVIVTSEANETYSFHVAKPQNNFTVAWGDGEVTSDITEAGVISHLFQEPGTYTNQVSGKATRVAFGEENCTPWMLWDILTPLHCGVTGISNATRMFRDATNITAFTCGEWFDESSKNVTTFANMFMRAYNFNQDVNSWDVSKVNSMYSAFEKAYKFNQDLDNWNTGSVTHFTAMFRDAYDFNGAVSNWNVSAGGSMLRMFNNASSFNQEIGDWQVDNVTTMESMFQGATVFNQDIGNWNVGQVVTMRTMFSGALAFNQDIGRWNVSEVTTMQSMFTGQVAFDQNISNWDISNVANMTTFFTVSGGFSTENYNRILIKWSKLELQKDVVFNAGGKSKYDLGVPAECRADIIANYSWQILDDAATGKHFFYPATRVTIR